MKNYANNRLMPWWNLCKSSAVLLLIMQEDKCLGYVTKPTVAKLLFIITIQHFSNISPIPT